jgi:hypothetical protein
MFIHVIFDGSMLIQLLFGLVPISGVKNTNTASGFREVDQTFRTRAYLTMQNRNQWKISKAGLTHKVCEYMTTELFLATMLSTLF